MSAFTDSELVLFFLLSRRFPEVLRLSGTMSGTSSSYTSFILFGGAYSIMNWVIIIGDASEAVHIRE